MSRYSVAISLLAFVLWHVSPTTLRGQDSPAEPDPEVQALEAKIRIFFQGVSAGQPQQAYDDLLVGAMKNKKAALQSLIDKTNKLEEQYGKYRESERVAVKRVGKDLILMKHLYKCESFPVVWYFTFYRTPGDTRTESGIWRVVTVRFDTELELLAF